MQLFDQERPAGILFARSAGTLALLNQSKKVSTVITAYVVGGALLKP